MTESASELAEGAESCSHRHQAKAKAKGERFGEGVGAGNLPVCQKSCAKVCASTCSCVRVFVVFVGVCARAVRVFVVFVDVCARAGVSCLLWWALGQEKVFNKRTFSC